MAEFFSLDENMKEKYDKATDNGRISLQCLDWNNDELSLVRDGGKEL